MPDRLTRRDILRALGTAGTVATGGHRPLAALATSFLSHPFEEIPADQGKKWKGSALGSLYPFVKQQQQKTRQRLAFLNRRPKDLEEWKSEARAKVFELLAYRPEECAPQAQVLERVDKGDYVRERLTFRTAPEVEVPAYLLIPKHAKFPAPAVVALHDHGGFYYFGKEKLVEIENEHPVLTAYRKEYYDGLSFPAALARRGYVVITIDMFYFGERRLILDADLEQGMNDRNKFESKEAINSINDRNAQAEGRVLRNILASGFTWAGVIFWDDIRTLDYLQTRPEVDPNRLASVGLSIGGYRTNFLAGLDPRIKAACVAGWMTSLRHLYPGFAAHTMPSAVVPDLLDYLDYPDIGSLTMPNPLLVVHGQRDTLFPPEGVHAAFENLTRCYEAIGKPERFRTLTFDGPHKFPTHAQQQMIEWFDRWV